jgi:hypothetical protein
MASFATRIILPSRRDISLLGEISGGGSIGNRIRDLHTPSGLFPEARAGSRNPRSPRCARPQSVQEDLIKLPPVDGRAATNVVVGAAKTSPPQFPFQEGCARGIGWGRERPSSRHAGERPGGGGPSHRRQRYLGPRPPSDRPRHRAHARRPRRRLPLDPWRFAWCPRPVRSVRGGRRCHHRPGAGDPRRVAARQLAQEWASAAPGGKATALGLVHVNETINFALASLFNFVFAAATFILFGLAVVLSGVYPRWLG